MKAVTAILGLLGIGGVVGAVYYSLSSKDQPPEAEGPPGAMEPPSDQTGKTATGKNETSIYSMEAGPGAEAIRGRMKELFQYRDSKMKILQSYDILGQVFQGITYRSGVASVISALFGNVYNLPVYPTSLQPDTVEKLKAVRDVESFEKITSTAGIDTAFSIWRSALNLPTGETLWLEQVMEILQTGGFGPHGKADKNWSERYDAYTKDMQTLAANLVKSSDKLNDALRQQAISDLRGKGWRFTGIDA